MYKVYKLEKWYGNSATWIYFFVVFFFVLFFSFVFLVFMTLFQFVAKCNTTIDFLSKTNFSFCLKSAKCIKTVGNTSLLKIDHRTFRIENEQPNANFPFRFNLPSASTSFIISCNSASVGFWPSDRITVPNSFVVIVPSPSLSKSEKASLNSAICSSVNWSA